eukprot:g15712.t1
MSTTAATTAQADQTERRPDPSPTSSPLRKKARLQSPPTACRPVLAEEDLVLITRGNDTVAFCAPAPPPSGLLEKIRLDRSQGRGLRPKSSRG